MSGLQSRLKNVGQRVQDRFSPRSISVITYTDKATGKIETTMLRNARLEILDGVFAVATHDTGSLRIEAQHLHAFETKAWPRADYKDDLEDAPEDGDELPQAQHAALRLGRW